MMLMARVRSSGGQVSLTSTAPEAHSPPMPKPSTMRHAMSCQSVCDVAAPNEQTEKMRMVAMRARVRPARSATMPNTIPPTADVTSVTVPSNPAVPSSKPKYALRCPIAITYSRKSMASSIHPSFAAASARHWSLVMPTYHGFGTDSATIGFQEEGLEVERRADHVQRTIGRSRPLFARPVAIQLDPVLVRIGQVDGFTYSVVARALQGNTCLEHPPDDGRKFATGREPDGDVVQSRRSRRRRPRIPAVPGIE